MTGRRAMQIKKKTLRVSSRRPCVFEGQSPKNLFEARKLCQASTCDIPQNKNILKI
jgi:hypothetical protein